MANRTKLKEHFFVGSKSRLLFPLSKIAGGGTLFVEPSERADYETLHKKNWNIVSLEKDNGGFGFLLNSMMEYA